MKYLFRVSFFSFIYTILLTASCYAQYNSAVVDVKTITTAVPILTVSPDARAAALGDAGVATSPDAAAPHWNPGKLGFIKNDLTVALSVSPWLANIINDMSLSYLSGTKRLNDRSAVALSMLYFDLGDIQFTDQNGRQTQQFSPKEYAFNVSYGQQLSENLGIGVGARFIRSNLSAGVNDSRPGNSAAVDVGAYYTKDLTIAAKEYNLSLGANISNVGAKISYTDPANKDFLPANLRLGTALTKNLDPFNKFTLAIDLNKLLVPSPDSINSINKTQSVPSAIFTSFADASGGFSEELQEITLSTGLEYWYNDLFAARLGYFYESPEKGDRHYLSGGLGLRYQKFGIDVAYLLPNGRNNPLANTVRFTLTFNIENDEDAGGNR